MAFVYLHVVWFACWIGFGVEKYPYGLLTMIVSLEAIFLSTFVIIVRTAPTRSGRRSPTSSEDGSEEKGQNLQLLDLSRADPRADEGGPRFCGAATPGDVH